MNITLKHVAQKAGFSWQTASKVLNDQGHLFRPETRQRVEAAARKLGYVPNASARNMRYKRTRQIGLLLRNEEGHRYHNLAAFVLLLGINARLEKDGYLLSIVRVGDLSDSGMNRSRVFDERVIDGLIAFSQFPTSVADWVSEKIPQCIWVDSNRFGPFNCIRRDENEVGLCIAKRLLNMGYRKFYWAGPGDSGHLHFSVQDRFNSVASCLEENGCFLDRLDSWPKNDKRWVYTQLPKVLSNDSVVVAYNVHAARAVLVGSASLGLSIGRDYGLVCCDDTPELYEAWPGLCRVDFDRFKMGYLAADMLLEILTANVRQTCSRKIKSKWVIGNTAWGPKNRKISSEQPLKIMQRIPWLKALIIMIIPMVCTRPILTD